MPPAAGGQPSRASEAQASDYHDHIVHIVMAVKGAGLCLRLRLRHGTVTVIGGHRNGSYSTMPWEEDTDGDSAILLRIIENGQYTNLPFPQKNTTLSRVGRPLQTKHVPLDLLLDVHDVLDDFFLESPRVGCSRRFEVGDELFQLFRGLGRDLDVALDGRGRRAADLGYFLLESALARE